MYSLILFNISVYLSTVSYFSTVIVNSLIIYMTLFHTRSINGAYGVMIIIAAIIGAVFSTIDFVVHPFLHSYNHGFLFFSKQPIFGVKKSVSEIILGCYNAMYATVISFITVQFIYRCGLLCGKKWCQNFGFFKLFLAVFYAFGTGSIYGFICYYFSRADEYAFDYFREVMKNEYNTNIEKIPAFVIIAYEQVKNTTKIRWKDLYIISGATTCLLFQYSIVLFCGMTMHSKIDKKFNLMSRRLHRVQKQFLKALVLQVTSPLILIDLLTTIVFIIPYFDLKLNFPTGIADYGFSIYPLIDSLILLVVVSEYKTKIKKLLRQKFLDSKKSMELKRSDCLVY